MTATLVAAIFGLGVALGGAGTARRIDFAAPPFATAAVVTLAALVVLATDVSAVWRFEATFVAAVWLATAISGMRALAARAGFAGIHAISRSVRARIVAIAGLALAAPMLVLPVPLDTDAQGFGFLALAIREGGTLGTLAPFRPGIAYLYSPGALIVFAAMSAWTRVSMPAVMMGVSHACVLLFVWVAWDFGEELGRRESNTSAWPWVTCLAATLNVGLWSALLDAHYPAIMAALFVLAFVTMLLRFVRTGRWRDFGGAAVTLAAVVTTHSDSTLAVALGIASFAALSRFAADKPTSSRWLASAAGIPAAALLLIAPWMASLWPLIRAGVHSPFEPSLSHWRQLVGYQGIIWPALAVVGAFLGLRRRRMWALVMIGWVVLVVESSTVAWLERSLPLVRDLTRFRYPYSMAWHAPILPCLALATGGIVWSFGARLSRWQHNPGPSAVAAVAFAVAVAVIGAPTLLAVSRRALTIHGAFASPNDLKAMRWIRDNTPPRARILNYPGDYDHLRDWEGHWAPAVAERDCAYFRMAPFFVEAAAVHPDEPRHDRNLRDAFRTQQAMLVFWRDPANPSNVDRLRAAEVSYVLVPEWIGDPASLEVAWRWQPPARLTDVVSSINRASYLPVIYRSGGAQVRAVPSAGGFTPDRPPR